MLRADAPHPQYRDELNLFGRFVCTWDMEVVCFTTRAVRSSTTSLACGLFRGSWTGGQSRIFLFTRTQTTGSRTGYRRIGTTLRFYDPGLGAWHVIWLGVVTGDLGVMIGRPVGDEIWIEEKESDGSLTRWMFTEITPDRFHWKGMTSSDQGDSWRTEQEMFANRRSSKHR